jgi:nucleotide-binding universal stress UspA family protein
MMFKKILVPLDGSIFASKALIYAVEVARKFDSEIVLLRVAKHGKPVPASAGIMPGMADPKSMEIAIEAVREEEKLNLNKSIKYLRNKAKRLKDKNIAVSFSSLVGDADRTITKYAVSKNIDLIIMTSHGASGIKRFILGSVADYVLKNSNIPVMIIRPAKNK